MTTINQPAPEHTEQRPSKYTHNVCKHLEHTDPSIIIITPPPSRNQSNKKKTPTKTAAAAVSLPRHTQLAYLNVPLILACRSVSKKL